MSELVLLLLRIGFLILLWLFVFGVVYSLRADVFGVRARKLPAEAAAGAAGGQPAASTPPSNPSVPSPATPRPASSGPATANSAKRIVITSGPKAGLEIPLSGEPLTIGRSSESGLVIRDDYTSSHHARLVLRGGAWTIQDLDSTNGTFLDGKRLTGSAVPVAIGTPIKVGATTFELRA